MASCMWVYMDTVARRTIWPLAIITCRSCVVTTRAALRRHINMMPQFRLVQNSINGVNVIL